MKAFFILLVGSCLVCSSSLAETRRAGFEVTAYVPPEVRIDAIGAPAALELVASDVERGFKDVPARYRIKSNVPRGYLLRFAVREGLSSRIDVLGLGAPVPLSLLGGDVMLHSPPLAGTELELRFRVHLDTAARPGRYQMPVAVWAEPL